MLSKILALLATLNSAKIREFIQIVTSLLALFNQPVETGGLETVQLSADDQKNFAAITEKLSADCPSGAKSADAGAEGVAMVQQAFDIGKLLAFIKLMRALFGQT